MYELSKGLLLGLLKAPSEPPAPPAGSPGFLITFRASKNYLKYKLILMAVGYAVPILGSIGTALAVAMDRSTPELARLLVWALPAFFFGLGFFSYVLIRLEYEMRYYIVTDRAVRIREGIWSIREITVTFANVQHLEIQQGPIMQMLGISDLLVHTAGGGAVVQAKQGAAALGHLGALRGIDNAAEVRDKINGLLQKYRDAGLGDADDHRKKAARASAGFSPEAVQVLREIRDDLRSLQPPAASP